MSGELSVLNCTAGDIKIVVSKDNPIDLAKAKRMITDMLRRGYIIAIEVDGELVPVKKFDPEKGEYIIVESATSPEPPKGQKKRGGYQSRRVPMDKTKATAVPMTSGG